LGLQFDIERISPDQSPLEVGRNRDVSKPD